MHAQITTPAGLTLMASGIPSSMPHQEPAGHSVSLSGDDEAELQGYWDALLDGDTVVLPFKTPPWGGRFGMLKDRFGIDWML
ncbi:MAG: VOC family protein, partial [Microbacterium sp.]|uniref:VOC family protein n=1 Tax=Microbacterium sp. TaxID=51671 RepID=UPI003A8B220F